MTLRRFHFASLARLLGGDPAALLGPACRVVSGGWCDVDVASAEYRAVLPNPPLSPGAAEYRRRVAEATSSARSCCGD